MDGDPDDLSIDDRIVDFLTEKWDVDERGPAMISQVVIAASYIDEDGDERWSSHTMGNGRTTNAVGLLEYAKRWLIDNMLYVNQDED